MLIDTVVARLKLEEGFRRLPYVDSQGVETVGYGFAIREGFTQEEAEAILELRVKTLIARLRSSYNPWFDGLTEGRQSVIVSLCYNVGMDGARKFEKFWNAVTQGAYNMAATELLNSLAAKQAPSRYRGMAETMRRG